MSREQQLAGTWKPRHDWEKPVKGDTLEQLEADKKLFAKFHQQYAIINSYYPELPDIASAIYLDNVLKQNEQTYPAIDWRKMYTEFEETDIDYDTPIWQLVKIRLVSKELSKGCKAYGITRAIDLLMHTPLQYHALVEETGTDHPYIINTKMDAEDAKTDRIGENYDDLDLAHLSFVRAVIADRLWNLI